MLIIFSITFVFFNLLLILVSAECMLEFSHARCLLKLQVFLSAYLHSYFEGCQDRAGQVKILCLQETLAITHNYVSTVNLPHVLKFLRSGRQDLVSGCAIHDRALLHDRFLAALQSHNREALATVQLPAARKQSSKKHLSHLFQDSTPACSIGVTGEQSSCAPSTHKFGFF